MRLEVTYAKGGSFAVEADDVDDFESLYAIALKTLWGNNAKAMTLDEADKWLGWSK